MTPGDDRTLGELMADWQRRDFAALDAAWQRLAGQRVPPGFQRAYIERPRGHSKTSDMAVHIAWILLYAPHPVHGLAAAADRDQAALIAAAVRNLADCNPAIRERLKFQRHEVKNVRTGSKLEIISSDVGSSWGALPDFVICDELCHWPRPELWHSLFSAAAKRDRCVLAILTNAGVGHGWQWDVREAARSSSRWYFSSLTEPQAAWLTPEWLDEQRALLPPTVFDRLWRNLWQHSDGHFLTLAEAEACCDKSLRIQTQAQPDRTYVAAVDYAEKHDLSVGVVVHREGPRVIVDRMDVAVPQPDVPTKVSWVEDWMARTAENFPGVTFVVDEYQLLGTIERLSQRHQIHRFAFAAGQGNHALALGLRKLIVHCELAWYPGCGQLPGVDRRDDLETELASLLLRQSATGRCRIDHVRDGRHHDDRSFALGAACLYLLQDAVTDAGWHITGPTNAGEFAW